MANLFETLAARFPADRARPFARLDDGRLLDYAWLTAGTARYARLLDALGVRPGDRVMVQAPKSIEMLLVYLAALRTGAVFVPLNPAYTAGELAYFIADAEPRLILCDPARREEVAGLGGAIRIETLGERGEGSLPALAAGHEGPWTSVPRAEDDLAAILYTSGTTGLSKGAMLSHGNLASNALMLADFWRFTGDDVLLHALPIFHTHGLFVATNVVLAAGASMIFQPRFDAAAVMAALPDASVIMGVPTFYIRLLDEPGLDRALAWHMRLFISGSAPLSADIHREFAERTGHAILERYGMTETNMNCSNPYDGARVAGTVGPPLPGVAIRIADPETGAPVAPGEVGVIEIAGPNVFEGYWRKPEKTAEDFRGGYFISGDLGFIDARGYVSIVGRAKDLIIAGGYNIYPAEVEAALDELPQVHESAVVGVPHRDLGEAVVAAVVPRSAGFADEAAIIAALAGRLARFKQPRRVIFLPELPKNSMGKVQKTVLRERFAATFAGD
jgi:malonyl-CoA/methylmalonyl-CoA synthetase